MSNILPYIEKKKFSVIGLLLLMGCVLLSVIGASGQTSPVKPIVTDQTSLLLSNKFQATTGMMNQSHDFAFASNDGFALFLRKAGAAAPVRIVQRRDPVPGVANGWFYRIISISGATTGVLINDTGQVVFVSYYFVNGSMQTGLFKYDGTSIQPLALSTDVAPGTGGLHYVSFSLLGFNARGDIAFFSSCATFMDASRGTSGVFILPAGGSPAKVAVLGDSVPGGTVYSINSIASFNARGELAFLGTLNNGSTQKSTLFVGTASSVRVIASTGDPTRDGGTGTFSNINQKPFINNLGVVAFSDGSGIWMNSLGYGTEQIGGSGSVIPGVAQINGSQSLYGFNDLGDVLFGSPYNLYKTKITISDSPAKHFYANDPTVVVNALSAYSSHSIAPVMNSLGDVAFFMAGTQSGAQNGIYQQAAGGTGLTKLVQDGDAVGSDGGTLYLQDLALTTSLTILDDGSVQFPATMVGGPAEFAQLLYAGNGIQKLMSTSDSLPEGSRVALTPGYAAGDYVAFVAQLNGGQLTAFIQNVVNGTTTPVATSGDSAPGTTGRLLFTSGDYFSVNSRGQAALFATVAGTAYPKVSGAANGVFLFDLAHGLQKGAVPGDTVNIEGSQCQLGSVTGAQFSRLNSNGQIAFVSYKVCNESVQSTYSIFLTSLNDGVKFVVGSGSSIAGEGSITITAPYTPINDAGQVAFMDSAGIGLGAVGKAPARIVKSGDIGPSGNVITSIQGLTWYDQNRINEYGQVTFSAYEQTQPSRAGLYLGAVGKTPQAFVVQGQAVPGSEGLSISSPQPLMRMNNTGVLFPALLSGGTTDSGVFLWSAADSNLKTLYLQGQPAPGTSEVFGSVPMRYPNYFGLGRNGHVYFISNLGQPSDGNYVDMGLFRYRPDGILEKVIKLGDTVPDNGGTVLNINTSNQFGSFSSSPLIWTLLTGGTASEAIYMPLPVTLQTDTSSLSFASVDGANPEAKSLAISSSGGSALNWTATASDAWISLDSTSGSTPGTLNVSVNASGLSQGIHHGTITINGGAAQNVDVTFRVQTSPSVVWSNPEAIPYGTVLSATQLNATVPASIPGTLVYTPEAGTVLGAGMHTLSVTFTPTDVDNYASVTRTVSLTVNKATPSIHWATPTVITSGTALGDAQLNATADVPGTFVYTPAKGTVPEVGTQTLSVQFVPTDTSNYTEATATVSLKVNESLVPVITSLSPALVKAGTSGFSLVVSGTGFGSGATVMWNGSARTTTAVSGGLQAEISAADIASSGTVDITVANPAGIGGAVSSRYQFAIDTAAAASSGFTATAPTTVTVELGKDTQVPVTVAGITSGANVTATCLNAPTGVTCSYKNGVLIFTTSPNTPPGTYTITTVFSTTTQTTAMRHSNQGYFALWLGLGGLPFGLIWAGGTRKTVCRCGIVVAGLLLIVALASCGGGATTSNPPSGNPTTPVTRQSSVVMTLTVR